MSEAPKPASEFSCPLAVDNLGAAVVVKQIAANEAERASLARRFRLLALDHLSADLRVQRLPGTEVIRVSGQFVAEATQACVVSLEPVSARLNVEFSQLYAPAPETPQQEEQIIDVEAEDPPEEIGPDGLDLGETVVQQFALALDPYPRAPGAQSPAGSEEALEAARSKGGPFAALKALQDGE
ncbi:MAG: YceD family protein [Alphaproteobacteria bacterium]